MTAASITMDGRRVGLDQLVQLIVEPGFAMRYRRPLKTVERAGHVSLATLAHESPRSRYVRRWKRHARTCSSCAAIFTHLGFSIK